MLLIESVEFLLSTNLLGAAGVIRSGGGRGGGGGAFAAQTLESLEWPFSG